MEMRQQHCIFKYQSDAGCRVFKETLRQQFVQLFFLASLFDSLHRVDCLPGVSASVQLIAGKVFFLATQRLYSKTVI